MSHEEWHILCWGVVKNLLAQLLLNFPAGCNYLYVIIIIVIILLAYFGLLVLPRNCSPTIGYKTDPLVEVQCLILSIFNVDLAVYQYLWTVVCSKRYTNSASQPVSLELTTLNVYFSIHAIFFMKQSGLKIVQHLKKLIQLFWNNLFLKILE
jgi:hypothetical protein